MKKKKQKSRKRNKDDKAVAENVSSQDFRSSRPEFESFLGEMIRWFSDHRQQVDEAFGHSDTDKSGSVNLKDFELGLMNLDAPCQRAQLLMLTQLLKTDDDTISYRDLSERMQSLRPSDGAEIHTQISEDASRMDRPDAHQPVNPGKDRFVRLTVRLIPFDHAAAAHPANFEVVLSSSSRVFTLIRIIQDRVGIQTSRLEVFRSRAPTEEARLPPESSLEECGLKGGPEETPSEDTVYYDYSLPLTDCPILNCDHYFRSTPDSAATRRSHCP
ncbi:hypothetical protein D9C73_026451 [Collichthys lucidus]|uniref:EF-hand domain-containing protein n=1 Tax=Collichthys lucidus TaxID=240159 RepID=A0A4U5VTQ9_COLLU|nr:hypothetical protein D9C73_026451 [Collichthys lucidus]